VAPEPTALSGSQVKPPALPEVMTYQTTFRSGYYKRFEDIFNFKFHGFRLLFLTNSPARSTSLSRLVQEMPPSDFIWLTNQEKMFSDGLSAEIWARGGKTDRPPQSIIGSDLSVRAPLIGSIKQVPLSQPKPTL
jgi:hypothetical protein